MAAQSRPVPSLNPTTTEPSQTAVYESTTRPMSLLTSAFTPRAPFDDPTPAPRRRRSGLNPEAPGFCPVNDSVTSTVVPSAGGRAGQGGQATRGRGHDAQAGYVAQRTPAFLQRGPATPSGMGGQLGVPGQNTFTGQFQAGRRMIVGRNFHSRSDMNFADGGFESFNHQYSQQEGDQQNPRRWRDSREDQADANGPSFVSVNGAETSASDTAAAPSDVADSPPRGQRNVGSRTRDGESE